MVSQTDLTLNRSLRCQTTNNFVLSSRLNRWLTDTAWFLQWLMLVTRAWQMATCYKTIALFVCTSLFLFKCFNKVKAPTAAFKCMPHRHQNIIWGQFSLTKSIKGVNLYHTHWCSQTWKTNSPRAASLCSCVTAAVALQKGENPNSLNDVYQQSGKL